MLIHCILRLNLQPTDSEVQFYAAGDTPHLQKLPCTHQIKKHLKVLIAYLCAAAMLFCKSFVSIF